MNARIRRKDSSRYWVAEVEYPDQWFTDRLTGEASHWKRLPVGGYDFGSKRECKRALRKFVKDGWTKESGPQPEYYKLEYGKVRRFTSEDFTLQGLAGKE